MPELNMNGVFDNLQDAREFVRFAKSYAPDALGGDAFLFQEAYQKWRGEMYGRTSFLLEPYTSDNKFYDSGPFSWMDEDIICETVDKGSNYLQWLPTNVIESEFETVSHWDAVWSEFITGTDPISDAAALVIPACDYGPGMKMNTFQYEMTYGQFSFKTDTFDLVKTWLLKDKYKRSPQFTRRFGPFAGMPLRNDAEVQIAGLGMLANTWLNTITIDGVRASNPNMMWDGTNTIFTNTYVGNHLVSGSGGTVTSTAKPKIINAAAYSIAQLVASMQMQVLSKLAKTGNRQWSVAVGDMAFVMHPVHWHYIARELAANGSVGWNQDPNRSNDADANFNALMANPQFPAHGYSIPVLLDTPMAETSSTNVVGDIYLNIRRANGENVLEQQYADFNKIQLPTNFGGGMNVKTQNLLGGIAHVGELTEGEKCIAYFMEMIGRIISRAQFLQTRYTNVSMALPQDYDMESNAYNADFYVLASNGGVFPSGI